MISASLTRINGEDVDGDIQLGGNITSGVIRGSDLARGQDGTSVGSVRFFNGSSIIATLGNLEFDAEALQSRVSLNDTGLRFENVQSATFGASRGEVENQSVFREEYRHDWYYNDQIKPKTEVREDKKEFESYIVLAREEETNHLRTTRNPRTGSVERGNLEKEYAYKVNKKELLETLQRAYPELNITCLPSFFKSYGATEKNPYVLYLHEGSLIHSLLDFIPFEVRTNSRLTRRPFFSFVSTVSVLFGEEEVTFWAENNEIMTTVEYEIKAHGFAMVKKATGSPFYKIGNKNLFQKEASIGQPNF